MLTQILSQLHKYEYDINIRLDMFQPEEPNTARKEGRVRKKEESEEPADFRLIKQIIIVIICFSPPVNRPREMHHHHFHQSVT